MSSLEKEENQCRTTPRVRRARYIHTRLYAGFQVLHLKKSLECSQSKCGHNQQKAPPVVGHARREGDVRVWDHSSISICERLNRKMRSRRFIDHRTDVLLFAIVSLHVARLDAFSADVMLPRGRLHSSD